MDMQDVTRREHLLCFVSCFLMLHMSTGWSSHSTKHSQLSMRKMLVWYTTFCNKLHLYARRALQVTSPLGFLVNIYLYKLFLSVGSHYFLWCVNGCDVELFNRQLPSATLGNPLHLQSVFSGNLLTNTILKKKKNAKIQMGIDDVYKKL